MAVFLVPTLGVNETFSVTLGVPYSLQIIWRDDPCGMGGWFLDIGDGQGAPLVSGIPLVPGVDLLAQYGYLGFTGGLWVQNGQDPEAPPTFDGLGTDWQLYWVAP
jgi:uncharacterized protein DUF6983